MSIFNSFAQNNTPNMGLSQYLDAFISKGLSDMVLPESIGAENVGPDNYYGMFQDSPEYDFLRDSDMGVSYDQQLDPTFDAVAYPSYSGYQDNRSVGDYLSLSGSGTWNPLYTEDQNGVRQRGFSMSGAAQARVPLDPIMEDAILRLSAGGYRYGGDVKLPQRLQEMGAPDYIDYGDTALSRLGIGVKKDDFSSDLNYNPQTEDISANLSSGGLSADLGYNRDTKDKYIKARYGFEF
mgnify:CR=1 FL=1